MEATVSREDAARFTRVVEADEILSGIKMVAMAGNSVVHISSLADAEAFLKPITAEEAAGMSANMQIHYVEPTVLASWVRDTIGDAELAARLDAVIDPGEAYGLQVPEMKRVIAERLAELHAVLDESE